MPSKRIMFFAKLAVKIALTILKRIEARMKEESKKKVMEEVIYYFEQASSILMPLFEHIKLEVLLKKGK